MSYRPNKASAEARSAWGVASQKGSSGDSPQVNPRGPSYKLDMAKKAQLPVSGTPSLPSKYPAPVKPSGQGWGVEEKPTYGPGKHSGSR